MYALGGHNAAPPISQCDLFNLKHKTSHQIPSINNNNKQIAACFSMEIILFGGDSNQSFIFNIETESITKHKELKSTCEFFEPSEIYAVDYNCNIHVYFIPEKKWGIKKSKDWISTKAPENF